MCIRDRVWNALPFESIMNNAVVTDGSMYCWVPMLSFAPIRHKERIDLAPVGRLRYSQNTGNKVIIQYDTCNEDIMLSLIHISAFRPPFLLRAHCPRPALH